MKENENDNNENNEESQLIMYGNSNVMKAKNNEK
jgi:hypothetical protein